MTTHRARLVPAAVACAAAAVAVAAGCGGKTHVVGQLPDAAAEHSAASGGSSGGGSGGAIGGRGGGASGGSSGGGGQMDAGPSDAGPGCGPGSPIGSTRPAGDGCNTCVCSEGNFWACTTAMCDPDASMPADASSASGGRAGTGGRSGSGGGSGSGSGGNGGGGRGGSGGVTTGGSGGGGGGRPAACLAAEMLSRSCTTDADCVAVSHTVDCCGSSRTTGLRATELARFREIETQCAASYPGCECRSRAPMTDDGSMVRPGANVAIACLGTVCTTFHPACGRPCTDGRICVTCASGPTTWAECTTSCDRAACTDIRLPLCQAASNGDTNGMYCTAAGIACGTP
jgi:hypothetical protein